MADKRPTGNCAHGNQAHQTVDELDHLQGFRVLDQLADIGGDRLLRADHLIYRKAGFFQQGFAMDKLGRTQPGNGGLHVERLARDLACHQIGLVEWRAGDQHIGVGQTGVTQHRGLNAVTHHAAQVQPVLQRRQPRRVTVHHRDVVAFGGQALGHTLADPTGAQDDNFHGCIVPGPTAPATIQA